MERMQELIEILTKASRAYYQEDREIMSDFEYDRLYDELCQLEKESGIVLSSSPTQKVGHQVLSSLQKVRHESRMLSLDKTKSTEDLKDFLGDHTGILSYKMDGLTVVLTYRNGSLVQAVTRGNGEIGEDITHNAIFFRNIPLKINFENELVLRGEAVISFKDFDIINENLEDSDKYKNPRNLCSGTVRQLNSKIAAERNVCFIAFQLVKAEGLDFGDDKNSRFEWLENMGFECVIRKVVNKDNIEAAIKDFEAQIPDNPFATDGLVLTFSSVEYSESLGTTAKFPKDSIAFKWADELAETTLTNVEWNTSRTGLINPIAEFDPVELEGTTVRKASLHNVSIIKELRLGIGDRITVYKANMIIPQIAENLTKSDTLEIPSVCPVCKEETELVGIRDGNALKCTNPNCRAQRIHSIEHFVSRNAMNVEGLSEATIEKFINKGFIDNYTDLFRLSRYEEEIKNMEGFGEKSYDNLIESIEKSRDVALPNFIFALGINHVGLSNAKLLCKKYRNSLEAIRNADYDELIAIDGYGDAIAHSLTRYFSSDKNNKLLDEALEFVRFTQSDDSEGSTLLEGKTFVITGDVHIYKNRKELQAKIEELGGKATSAVSAKTTYLINNNINSSSSKNKKAKELGIPIISEEDFEKMIQEQ